ncbi:hypothetical protein GQ55_9G090100 [Panicum hallii var. hallii]|uniref:Response regulatory domain-containing protein n=2 Tax=Panicum sect. Panicum TaxID=2100772 RepID=A0A2T7C1I1_9POAL|nr:hypothetical protein GQ55_9G090100 [Panicum hallii var. hallii]
MGATRNRVMGTWRLSGLAETGRTPVDCVEIPPMQLSVQRCCPGRQGHLRAGCYAGILKRLAGGRTAGQLVTRVATVHSACQRLRCLSWALSHRGRVAKRSAMAGAAAAAERRAIRVLLVEDEEIHRVLARALLRAGGGVVLDEAGNGAEAVRRVREGGAGAYDLILTDRQMPVMDGHEATRQIRALGVTTPIVGLSSDCLAADVDAFIKAGADDFTPKPLSKEKLNRILAKFNLA